MENDDLAKEISDAESELEKQLKLREQIQRSLDATPRDQQEAKNRLEIEKISNAADIKIAESQLAKLKKRAEEKLTVRAPASGVIPDFKRLDILLNRPVRAGDHLFDVMNDAPDAPWHLELLVEEKRMGHITRALKTQNAGSADPNNPTLQGDFTMVSLPQSKFKCHLTTIATRSTTDPELGTAFEMLAVADEDIPVRRIGLEVTVRLQCNECTLAYYMFGDVVEFFQREFWYW
jgi:hypothetical protein